jgi:AraC-like DNA-binding protein
MLKHPEMLGQLLSVLHPVIRQRWPDMDDGGTRDIAVQLADKPFWVRFHDGRVPGLSQSAQRWYLELHPLEPGELSVVGVVEDDRIARAIGFIHDNFKQSPSLNEIAEAAHVSPFHFHRLFSRYVGLSPKHYLQNKQLQVARWLLRATRTPIGMVAQETGFSSHGHFTSTFHRLVGVSPTEYRETH